MRCVFELHGSWSWERSSCDFIRGVAKQNADQTVKNGKFIIQAALIFLNGKSRIRMSLNFCIFPLKNMRYEGSFWKSFVRTYKLLRVLWRFMVLFQWNLTPSGFEIRSAFERNALTGHSKKIPVVKVSKSVL